jgi:O-antigen/teichoic acid export membrane protein
VAKARLGLEAFGTAQFGIAFVETCIPRVAFGYRIYGSLEVGANRDRPEAVGSAVSSVMTLRFLHLVASLAIIALLIAQPAYAGKRAVIAAVSFLLLAAAIETDFVHYGSQTVGVRNVLSMIAKVASMAGVVAFVRAPGDLVLYAVLSCSFALVLAAQSLVYNLRRITWVTPQLGRLKTAFRAALPHAVYIILMTLSDRFDVLLAEHFFGDRGTGLYAGQVRLMQSVSTAIGALGIVFFSESLATPAGEAYERRIAQSLWVLVAVVAPVAVGAQFAGSGILDLMYGADVASYAVVLRWLAWGALCQAGIHVFGTQVLLIRGRVAALNCILGAAILGGAALAWLAGAHGLGLGGIAAGSFACKVTAAFFCILLGSRLLSAFPWRELAGALLPAALMGGVLALAGPQSIWIEIAIGVVVYGAAFVICNRRRVQSLIKGMASRP